MLNPQLDLSGSCLPSPTNLGPTRPMWRYLSSGAVFRLPTNQMRMRFLIWDSRSHMCQSIWQRMQDCLLLNLYVPTGIEVTKSGLPVMVWLHGGAFLFGQGWDWKHEFIWNEGIFILDLDIGQCSWPCTMWSWSTSTIVLDLLVSSPSAQTMPQARHMRS